MKIKKSKIKNDIVNAYMKLRSNCQLSLFGDFNVIVIMQPKLFFKLREEDPDGIIKTEYCHFIQLCGKKTPLLISDEMPSETEFVLMTQENYERLEKEKLYKRLNEMFFWRG